LEKAGMSTVKTSQEVSPRGSMGTEKKKKGRKRRDEEK
jgi:hypothetical protein